MKKLTDQEVDQVLEELKAKVESSVDEVMQRKFKKKSVYLNEELNRRSDDSYTMEWIKVTPKSLEKAERKLRKKYNVPDDVEISFKFIGYPYEKGGIDIKVSWKTLETDKQILKRLCSLTGGYVDDVYYALRDTPKARNRMWDERGYFGKKWKREICKKYDVEYDE